VNQMYGAGVDFCPYGKAMVGKKGNSMKDTAHWVWQEPYLAALREQNPSSLRERLLTAEKAILFRMEVLHDAPDNLPEVQALREALNSLYAREPNKSPGPPTIVEDQEEYELGQRNWTKLGAVVTLAAVLSFATGWFLARKNSRSDVQSRGTASEPKGNVTSPDNVFASVRDVHVLDEPPPGSISPPQKDGASTPVPGALNDARIGRNVHAQPGAAEHFFDAVNGKDYGPPSVNGPTQEAVGRSLKRTTEGPSRPTGEPPSRPVESLTAEPKRGDGSSWSLNQLRAAPEVRAEPQVSPPPLIEDQPKATEVQKTPPVAQQPISPGVVTVSFGTYPSLRVPPELRSQLVGAKLQLGQVVSRVDPIYPEDARRQGIEGTVKLHAIVGTDGSVQGIEGITGPPLLVPAALGAVRQWRYQPTLLGAQPIETGQDITIVFRLGKDTVSAN
jgi:TonB family protein